MSTFLIRQPSTTILPRPYTSTDTLKGEHTMATSYFKKLRRQSKQHDPHEVTAPPPAPAVSEPSEEPGSEPVLDAEDERFLERLAAIAQEPEGPAPALPERPVVILPGGERKTGRDAQQAIMDGADAVPLPMSPPEVTVEDSDKGKGKASEDGSKDTEARRKSVMSYFALAQSKFKRSGEKDKDKAEDKDKKKKDRASSKDRKKAGDSLAEAAENAKSLEDAERQKENEDLSKILDDLNLSAVNNRVFSFSKESEELLNKFKLVLKDIVNGAPTAYNDLEKLFTDYDNQLKKMYGGLPPFVQNMIKSLPSKLTAALGPEIMAMQAEKPGFDAKQKGFGTASTSKKKSKRARVPSLKSLVSAEGAVATMLKSILNFLKLRFPALMTGTNVLLSLAVFLLLFVFWYCHKRGRETRLDKERLAAEGEAAGAPDSTFGSEASDNDGDSLLGESSTSNARNEEKPEPPLILRDNKEEGSAGVDDMPSVLHLPDPKTVLLPETPAEKQKEAPLPK
ncbi:hypothetical protein K491DRAFT_701219 [Lophiostoma macrostomum CBS 122681]|uniref:Uncharacterized protein n=1 Tax=Lophiostoma macrostomum CBS 122681 TaxID=1314788 RepID=A0A6A6TP39_9PLEO|nr:hypothetical protein K491DRAFT_701219 [Lophiostoma macrostomum CBS 122681]